MHLLGPFRDAPPTTWSKEEIEQWKMPEEDTHEGFKLKCSKFNPTPGSGHTGMHSTPPNNYPFYAESERYQPVLQSDGGQLSGASKALTPFTMFTVWMWQK
jgi:hypothetical protein